MSRTLRLVHRTGYTYNGPAVASYNEARLAPRANSAQTILHTRLEVTPTPWSASWIDYWGTAVTSFEVHEPHEELKVVSISTVTVDRKPVEGAGMTWQDYAADAIRDEFDELLHGSERTESGPDFLAAVAEVRAGSGTPAEFVQGVFALVTDRVDYVTGRTSALPTAAEAWQATYGGCQDIAHLVLAALRSENIPARYVTGYVLPDQNTEIGETIIGSSHAWIEWYDREWIAYDPARRQTPDDFFIEVAHGRDYDDVAPLRGIFTGAPGSKMFLTVEISRIS
ncbi:transglutaminase-like putative cysteine protease [Branchiibius hedensis]|uniref:Transglutaminase-like enzyme, putative cysteine protease n=1 Tax=Branchiibius hedensis TaxID=672460 RepID=A0A2Y8ZM33_9MICO|nr:transglutaminase family protein [Branchiibius hedensis]PWJ24016.1 transglutaminase-like putative cysteine protease [Branchiibius hedensis]SSA32834.1 Transglutaminase-like enzyme, putative cysteine protease [Branchiibius hedensis]